MFVRGCRVIFLQCGRGWSKTFTATWLASKWGLINPGSYILQLCPLVKQVKKIVWHPKLYENFIIDEFIANKNNSETSYELINGSRAEIDGSDNFDSQRGFKPNLVLADEYADFNAKWENVMLPNVGKVSGTIVFMGTPPEFPKNADGSDHHYVVTRNRIKRKMKDEPNKYFHLHLPTSNNPYFPADFLADEKERMHDLNQDYAYEREYEAKIVSGSGLGVFTFKSQKHDVDHGDIMEMVHANPDHFDLWIGADPATKGSKFGVVFMAINHYTSTPYWIGEIREDQTHLKTVGEIVPRIVAKAEELIPGYPFTNWNLLADSAAAWFIEEAWANHDIVFSPCQKLTGDKEDGLELMNDIFNQREYIISSDCPFTQLEFENAQRDRRGKPIKANDDLIDPSRYVLKASGFSFINQPKVVKKKNEDKTAWDNMQERYDEYHRERDWTYGIDI